MIFFSHSVRHTETQEVTLLLGAWLFQFHFYNQALDSTYNTWFVVLLHVSIFAYLLHVTKEIKGPPRTRIWVHINTIKCIRTKLGAVDKLIWHHGTSVSIWATGWVISEKFKGNRMNPSGPEIDWFLTSPYTITPESNITAQKKKEILTN